MLFWLPTLLVDVFSHFGFDEIGERTHIDPMLKTATLPRLAKVDWFSSDISAKFFSYDLAKASAQGYPAERVAPLKREKVDDGA